MLATDFLGIHLKNPLVLSAGFLGTNASILKRVAASGAGAITMKSIGPKPRAGNPNPTIISFGDVVMNAVGLPSPGYMNLDREWDGLKGIDVPLFSSFYAGSIGEFAEVAEAIVPHKPALLDVNIGCPNTKAHGAIFGKDPKIAAKVITAVKEVSGKIPVMPKLPPGDSALEVAKACVDAGADAIAGFNTWGPGMVIDINTRKKVMGFGTGGVSGPAIRPLMVKKIYDIYEAVDVPVVAIGGITTGRDAIEAIMAGASIVEIGSGTIYRGMDVFAKVAKEMETWMSENGVKSIKELIGSAH